MSWTLIILLVAGPGLGDHIERGFANEATCQQRLGAVVETLQKRYVVKARVCLPAQIVAKAAERSF